jgi:hypothetical protein
MISKRRKREKLELVSASRRAVGMKSVPFCVTWAFIYIHKRFHESVRNMQTAMLHSEVGAREMLRSHWIADCKIAEMFAIGRCEVGDSLRSVNNLLSGLPSRFNVEFWWVM